MKLVFASLVLDAILIVLLGLVYWQTMPVEREKVTLEAISSGTVSTNYFDLRESFRKLTNTESSQSLHYQIVAPGPKGEALTIDIAEFGDRNAENLVLHISGTHGVEGYIGSTIQSVILKKGFQIPDNVRLVFIHGLNPYGMAHIRRVNESNADLNRNFLLQEGQSYSGAPEAYKAVLGFLNPESGPSRIDLFYPEAAYNIAKHGFAVLKQAVAGGQYDYPKGIYFGGSKLEESAIFLKRFVEENFAQAKKLFVIEVHTGLGAFGEDVLFWPYASTHEKTKKIEAAIGRKLSSDDPTEGVGFKTPGDLQNEIPKLIPSVDAYWILQEFGVAGPVATLRALRDENRYYQNGGRDIQHWTKGVLLDAFSPNDAEWQRSTVQRGVDLFEKILLEAGR